MNAIVDLCFHFVSWPALRDKKRALARSGAKKWPAMLAALFSMLAILAPAARAQNAGGLDTSFNKPNGYVAIDLGGLDYTSAAAIDSKGRIVVVGKTSQGGKDTWSLVRYNMDGTPDTTFGNNGIFVTAVAGTAYAVAIDKNDDIFVAGKIVNVSNNSDDFAVAKFLASNGNLDVTNFGSGGVTSIDLSGSGSTDVARGIAIDGTGRIVAVGQSDERTGADFDFAVARFDAQGHLDTTFGGGTGWIVTDFGANGYDEANAVAIGSVSGKILVAGTSGPVAGVSGNFALARYNTDGTLDTSFGAGSAVPGTVQTDFSNAGSNDECLATVITEDQNGMTIFAAGFSDASGTSEDFAVARYKDDGSLDTTFGPDSSGKLLTDFTPAITDILPGDLSTDLASGIAIDSAGRIVVGGETGYNNSTGSTSAVALARYDSQGNLDPSFGSGGLAYKSFPGSISAAATGMGMAIDSNGNIVTAPTVNNADSDYLIARFLGAAVQTDLGVSIQGPATASAGDVVAYSITVTNNGPNDANQVVVSDPLPAGLTTPLTCDATGTAFSCSFPGGTGVQFGPDPLAAGSSATFTVKAKVDGAGGSTITNTVSVSSELEDTNSANDSASATTTVTSADLSITNDATPSAAVVGGTVTYTITVNNAGPTDATNVTISDTLPSGVTYVPNSCAPANECTVSGNTVTATFATVPNGGTAGITLQVTVNSGVADGSLITDTATVASDTADPNSANNSANALFLVQNKADLQVSQSVDKINQRQITYTITVTNAGPYAASQISLSDAIPTGAIFQSIAPGPWSCSTPAVDGSGTVSCTLSGLATNTSASIMFAVKVTVSGKTTITNTAIVTGATLDPDTTNNSSTMATRLNTK